METNTKNNAGASVGIRDTHTFFRMPSPQFPCFLGMGFERVLRAGEMGENANPAEDAKI